MSYSSADLKANLIPPKTLESGARVPPGLQIGEMTLQEHQDYLVWQKSQRKLTRQEAILAGHRPREVYEYFGPLDVKRDQVIPPAQAKVSPLIEAKPILELVAQPMMHVEDRPQALIGTSAAHGEPAGHLEGFRQLNESVPRDQFAESKARGYTGDSCPGCGNFTMVNNGTCLVCVGCGHTTGCS